MKSGPWFLLVGATQACLALAVVWIATRPQAPPSSPVTIHVSLDKADGEAATRPERAEANMAEPRPISRVAQAAQRAATLTDANRDILRLALQRILQTPSQDDTPSLMPVDDYSAWRATRLGELLNGLEDQAERLRPASRSSKSASGASDLLDSDALAEIDSVSELISYLRDPGAVDDLLSRPALLDRLDVAMGALQDTVPRLQGLGGAGRLGSAGDTLGLGIEALDRVNALMTRVGEFSSAGNLGETFQGLRDSQNQDSLLRRLRVLLFLTMLRDVGQAS